MKEKQSFTTELEPLAAGLAETFIQRWDLFPRQLDNGSYICVKEPLTQNLIQAHLQGEITLGVYLLDPNSQACFIVIDADDEDQMDKLLETARSMEEDNIPYYLERSRRGGHLWLFFEKSMPGIDVRRFGQGVMTAHGLEEIELYPKQDQLGDGPGSLVRMPFGVHRKDMERYGFITPFGQPLRFQLEDQIPLFFEPQTVPDKVFTEYREIGAAEPKLPEFTPKEAVGKTLSDQIKSVVSVQEFVGEYLELSPAGRGHCPFHDDKNRSFSVNVEKNYWHCFAGCGGGSIIDFWMKHRDLEFKPALGELAGLLLK
jgi:hypothetical protein